MHIQCVYIYFAVSYGTVVSIKERRSCCGGGSKCRHITIKSSVYWIASSSVVFNSNQTFLCQFITGLKLSMCFNSTTINNNKTKSITIKQNHGSWTKNKHCATCNETETPNGPGPCWPIELHHSWGQYLLSNPLNWELCVFVSLPCVRS